MGILRHLRRRNPTSRFNHLNKTPAIKRLKGFYDFNRMEIRTERIPHLSLYVSDF
jgi:hypothetical protein